MKVKFFEKDTGLDENSIGAGVYRFKIGMKNSKKDDNFLTIYIGESLTMLKRCGEHMYELYKNPKYFGLSERHLSDNDLELVVEVYQKLDSRYSYPKSKYHLRKMESLAIAKLKPLSQNKHSDRLNKNRVNIVGNAIDELKLQSLENDKEVSIC